MGIPQKSHPQNEETARAGLSSIEDARAAAVRSTARPARMTVLTALTIGVGFGFALWGGVVGWSVFWSLLVVALVIAVIDARRVRRHGRLLDSRLMGGTFLRVAIFSLLLVGLRSVSPPDSWQPWFYICAGLVIAGGTYGFMVWEEKAHAKLLASGDFDPYTLF